MATIKLILKIAKYVFTPIAIIFLIYSVWISWDVITSTFEGARVGYLIFGIFIWMLLHFFSPLFTVFTLSALHKRLVYKDAFYIHASRLPAKYLPGGIWHTVARAYDYRRDGIPLRSVGFYILFENLVIALVTLTLGGLIVLTIPEMDHTWDTIIRSISLSGLLFLLTGPFWIRLFPQSMDLYFQAGPYAVAIAIMIVYWLLAGFAFVLYLAAFPGLSLDGSSFQVAGVYVFSWGVGFITLFAPQGIGIFEFVSGKLLNPGLGLIGMMAILAGFRFLVLIADCLAWIISLLLVRKSSS